MIGADLILLALTAIWGLTFPLVQTALRSASPLVFVALRFALAALLFPILVWAVVVTAVLATSLALWGQLRFQPRISTTAAAIIYSCEPVFAGVAAWIMLGTVPGRATLMGAALIVCGMLLSSASPKVKPEIP